MPKRVGIYLCVKLLHVLDELQVRRLAFCFLSFQVADLDLEELVLLLQLVIRLQVLPAEAHHRFLCLVRDFRTLLQASVLFPQVIDDGALGFEVLNPGVQGLNE